MNNNKFFLRQLFKKERSRLSVNVVDDLSKKIFKNLINLNIWDKNFYHLYLSNINNKEVETNKIVNLLFEKDKRIFVPKIKDTNLIHVEIKKDTLYSTNKIGIKEPKENHKADPNLFEVVFIPLLAYDKQGNRVGYGGGYYDKFLGNIKTNPLKIGFSLFEPVDKIQDIEKHDVRLDYVITPKKVYSFT
ncbi:MAG: 5-formyltetrahydrofolate cyclo-ligase [Flavobacteriaceae bacterium]|nr:5-formyltetrahydrofolate cyclo-ligase [Flavobacteriaceae bacterium]